MDHPVSKEVVKAEIAVNHGCFAEERFNYCSECNLFFPPFKYSTLKRQMPLYPYLVSHLQRVHTHFWKLSPNNSVKADHQALKHQKNSLKSEPLLLDFKPADLIVQEHDLRYLGCSGQLVAP